ncbi:hypothetical protein H2201_005714 [Coniosporium apollinis]|uniref:Zn(2)-C6 fungal-type domain-containing protein n=1 Tax=Coniosporium apollinis TaxID=61459 RepID=A0ABQ9NT20_9PEZI|nr:hypothetical protein H2201_005714 [Coniosporium apollinis]
MDVSNLLTGNKPGPQASDAEARHQASRQGFTGHNGAVAGHDTMAGLMSQTGPTGASGPNPGYAMSPNGRPCKQVSFELRYDDPTRRSRIPMRVNIYPHDTTDSIVTTVKNFHGLYGRRGVIFEDSNGSVLIARYENFDNGMTVFVRAAPGEPEVMSEYAQTQHSMSPRKPRLGAPFEMLPPQLQLQPGSRPASRTAGKRSISPQSSRSHRSGSAITNAKIRSRPGLKARGNNSFDSVTDVKVEGADDYSDSDGGNASVTSSRRSKNEVVASADIDVKNIVEGGRRKRAKFDSSELPLFVPPQVPITTSTSSVSPQRRIGSHNGASPYSHSNQHTFSYTQPLPSPQSYGYADMSHMSGGQISAPFPQPQGGRVRTRGSVQYVPTRHCGSGASGILPTPDPTIGGSVISDEDVALQLMRLGDVSNFSTHGRTSTSTVDDALSGKAELASSDEDSEDGSDAEGNDLPTLPAHTNVHGHGLPTSFDSGETSADDYDDNKDGSFKGDSDELMPDEHGILRPSGKSKSSTKGRSTSLSKSSGSKPGKPRPSSSLSKHHKSKSTSSKQPISPTSLPPQSRKTSSASLNFQHQLGVDEEDMSMKPRCQRCRKSKKGCDRQRPCQRCKDAGIGIEGCVSEDEGNGRKGRYGRHMGVPVKKGEPGWMGDAALDGMMGAAMGYMPPPPLVGDKSKKRKR